MQETARAVSLQLMGVGKRHCRLLYIIKSATENDLMEAQIAWPRSGKGGLEQSKSPFLSLIELCA